MKFTMSIFGRSRTRKVDWAKAEMADDEGFLIVDFDIRSYSGDRYIENYTVQVTTIDDFEAIKGWIRHDPNGRYLIGPECQYPQAPEKVRRASTHILHRVVRAIAATDVLEEDALLLARTLTGVDLSDPMARIRAIAVVEAN